MDKVELKKKYDELLVDVETNDFYQRINMENRFNNYTCSCGAVTKTVDVDRGVTPFMMTCSECKGLAQSSMYNDNYPLNPAIVEWYRPDWDEFNMSIDSVIEHVLNGGLMDRKKE